jgi:hypothetical protein
MYDLSDNQEDMIEELHELEDYQINVNNIE